MLKYHSLLLSSCYFFIVLYRQRISLNKRFHIGHTLILYTQVVTLCTTRFNFQESYAMPIRCSYVFCVGLRTNYNYFYWAVRTEYFNIIQYYLSLWSCHNLRLCWVKAFSLNGFCDRVIQYREDILKRRQRTDVLLSQLTVWFETANGWRGSRDSWHSSAARNTNRTTKRLVAVVHFIWNTESRNSYKPKKGPSPFRLSFDKPFFLGLITSFIQVNHSTKVCALEVIFTICA
jgi:hypothetical protein